MTVDELRERFDTISRELREIETRARALTVERAETEEQLTQAAREEMSLRPLGSLPARQPRRATRRCVSERGRDAVIRLGRFTASELAAELECPLAEARRVLRDPEVAKMIEEADRFGRQVIYAYVAPTDPGEAFKAQQRLRLVEPEVSADLAMAGVGQAAPELLSAIGDKEVRRVAAEAVRDGWTITNLGGEHSLALVRAGMRPIRLVSSARNPGNAATHLRQKIRRQLRHAV